MACHSDRLCVVDHGDVSEGVRDEAHDDIPFGNGILWSSASWYIEEELGEKGLKFRGAQSLTCFVAAIVE